jgi:tRNA U34 5-methylaminomethyl-2-thiouridine-forming methyltransferase MnmC
MFNDELHSLTLSEDGSYTAYSKEYDEHYHSTKDGALHESLVKHVIPAFKLHKEKSELCILDICYGLGFNTLATIYYYQQNKPDTKLKIYSPELDASLVKSLTNFTYPKEFEHLRPIIKALSHKGIYEEEKLYIEVFLGDAREYVRKFTNRFDIVYQDAFSPVANPLLWTREYFADIKNAIKEDGVLTTYSIALPTRLALSENDFYIYLNQGEAYRDATVASRTKLDFLKEVDMQHKIACNPYTMSLRDLTL